jgi:hypothetical protein
MGSELINRREAEARRRAEEARLRAAREAKRKAEAEAKRKAEQRRKATEANAKPKDSPAPRPLTSAKPKPTQPPKPEEPRPSREDLVRLTYKRLGYKPPHPNQPAPNVEPPAPRTESEERQYRQTQRQRLASIAADNAGAYLALRQPQQQPQLTPPKPAYPNQRPNQPQQPSQPWFNNALNFTQQLFTGAQQPVPQGINPTALTANLTDGGRRLAQPQSLDPQTTGANLWGGAFTLGRHSTGLGTVLNPAALTTSLMGGSRALANPNSQQQPTPQPQPESGFNPLRLSQQLLQGSQSFGNPLASINPIGLAATAFGGVQAIADPKTRQALTQQLVQGAQGFGNDVALFGSAAWNSVRNWNSPESLQRAQAFYADQLRQGQQQGGLLGGLQQGFGQFGGAAVEWGPAMWNTVRNWDTMAYAREAQTFYAGQVLAGQKESGVTGFFQQAGGYLGGGLASLPGLATQISPGINQGIDWATAQRQQVFGFINNQFKDVPILGAQVQRVTGVMEQFAQYTSGIGKGAGAMVGGIAQMVTNPVDTAKGLYTMAEHIPTFGGVGVGPNPLKMLSATGDVLFNGADPKQRFASVLDIRQSAQQDAKFWQGALGSILQPMQESWNAGRPAEAIGQGVFEIGSLFLGGGGVTGKAGKLNTAARAARVLENAEDFSQLGRVANVAEEMSQVGRVGRVAGAMDNLGGLGGMLQRGRGALGGMFDNIVGVPQRFRQWGGNTFQAALQRGRGVFADLKGVGQGLLDEFGPQPSLRRMLGDDLGGRGFGLGDLWNQAKETGSDFIDWLSGKPRQPDLVTPEGVRVPASQLDNQPPTNTMAMSTNEVPGGKPGKQGGGRNTGSARSQGDQLSETQEQINRTQKKLDRAQKQLKRLQRQVEDVIEAAREGKIRRDPKYHGRLGDARETEILSNPDAVYFSEGNSNRVIYQKGGDIVVTESGSSNGKILTSYGPSGPRGESGASVLGGNPTDAGKPITQKMIINGEIPTPGGETLPPATLIRGNVTE